MATKQKSKFNSHLQLIVDYDSEKMWFQSHPANDCGAEDPDPPAYALIRLQYMEEYGDFPYKYHVEIHVCGPDWLSDEEKKKCADSYSFSLEEFKAFSLEIQCEMLVQYGLSAPVWGKSGNNEKKLLKDAKQELVGVNCLFGFYMDKPVNRIGATGWDWIRGNLFPEGFLKKD